LKDTIRVFLLAQLDFKTVRVQGSWHGTAVQHFGAHMRPSSIIAFSIRMLHRDDDISLFVPVFDISVSLGHLLQRVAPIDNGLQFSRLNQPSEENQVFDLLTGTS
jgi:hypothetical protein